MYLKKVNLDPSPLGPDLSSLTLSSNATPFPTRDMKRRGLKASAAPSAPTVSYAAARAREHLVHEGAAVLGVDQCRSPSLRRLDPHLASSAPHRRSTASHSANAAASGA
jgi:hypothetical protein